MGHVTKPQLDAIPECTFSLSQKCPSERSVGNFLVRANRGSCHMGCLRPPKGDEAMQPTRLERERDLTWDDLSLLLLIRLGAHLVLQFLRATPSLLNRRNSTEPLNKADCILEFT